MSKSLLYPISMLGVSLLTVAPAFAGTHAGLKKRIAVMDMSLSATTQSFVNPPKRVFNMQITTFQ